MIGETLAAEAHLRGRLASAAASLQEQAAQLEVFSSEARTDALTKLPNRRALDEELARRFAQWKRKRGSLSLLLLDVDHFKRLNDEYGHTAGDDVLRRLAEVLQAMARSMDLVARYGGEEFDMVLPESDLSAGKVVAERVRTAVEETPLSQGARRLAVTVSVGLSELTSADDPVMLIEEADRALYEAKRAGRNRCYFHDGHTYLPIPPVAAPDAPGTPSEDEERELGLVLDTDLS